MPNAKVRRQVRFLVGQPVVVLDSRMDTPMRHNARDNGVEVKDFLFQTTLFATSVLIALLSGKCKFVTRIYDQIHYSDRIIHAFKCWTPQSLI